MSRLDKVLLFLVAFVGMMILCLAVWGQDNVVNTRELAIFNQPATPSVTLLYQEGDKDVALILVSDEKGEMVVTVGKDGSITPGKNYKPDIAAVMFWQALAEAFPCK